MKTLKEKLQPEALEKSKYRVKGFKSFKSQNSEKIDL